MTDEITVAFAAKEAEIRELTAQRDELARQIGVLTTDDKGWRIFCLDNGLQASKEANDILTRRVAELEAERANHQIDRIIGQAPPISDDQMAAAHEELAADAPVAVPEAAIQMARQIDIYPHGYTPESIAVARALLAAAPQEQEKGHE